MINTHEKSDGHMNHRILFCSPLLGVPPKGGPELHVFNTLKAIMENNYVDVVTWDPEFYPSQSKSLIELNKEYLPNILKLKTAKHQLIISRNFIGWKRLVVRIVNLTYRTVTLFSLRNNTRIANQIISLFEKSKYDVVWISFANISSGVVSKVRRNSRTIKIVSGTDSVWSEFLLRSIPYKPFAYKIITYILGFTKKLQEKQLLRVSTVLTAVSEVDQNLYMRMSKKSCEVFCAYNVIDSSSYSPKNARNRINQDPIVLLAGTFGSKFSPMDYGTSWFLREVWPLVRKSNPDALLHLVGKRSDLLWHDDSSVGLKVFGEFESIVPFMERSALSVVPLWFESGTRFKILEAGAMNLPVVTTTLGAEGLRISACKDVYIADDPKSFANSILKALQIDYLEISGSSLNETVVKEYSEAVLVRQVDKVIAVASAGENKDASR